jgi:uncharacterized protein (TIGR03382 family)
MKKILTLLVSAVAATTVYGQGYFNFNNLAATGTIKIGVGGEPGQGIVGQFVGSAYSVSLYYSLTPISQPTYPTSLTLIPGTTGAMYGVGASEATQANGAGFFQGPNAVINGTADGQTVYVEAAVWWTAAGSWAQSQLGAYNSGYSAPVAIRLASGADNVVGDLSGLASFTVLNDIPEPATITLGGLGAAALLLFRRRK